MTTYNSNITDSNENSKEERVHHNLCFTYPQGEMSILPTFCSFLALFANLQAFPIFNYRGAVDFICTRIKNSSEIFCVPLYLNDETYIADDDTKFQHALRFAALCGILASLAAVTAFFLLAMGSCFVLKPRRLLIVVTCQTVAAILSIFTLMAGAANVCAGFEGCEKQSVHLETGANFMLAAFFLHLAAAAVTTLLFAWPVYQEMKPVSENKRLLPLQPPQQEGVNVTKSVTPNGETRTEREFVDENGQLVKEIIIEEAPKMEM